MASGEPAHFIASQTFARYANFLEPVIVLKIDKFPNKIYLSLGDHSFPVKCVRFPHDVQIGFGALGASKSKNINYWKIPS